MLITFGQLEYNVYLCRMKKITTKKIAFILIACSVYCMSYTHESNSVDEADMVSFEKEERVTRELEEQKKKDKATKVVATMYYAVENQCDSDPLITASLRKINPNKATEHKWIALSRDLLKRWGGKFDYGQKVKIINAGKKSGVYLVVDTMNPRFRNKIDILETKGTPLYKYTNVKIYKI